jgi:hypothetical protein
MMFLWIPHNKVILAAQRRQHSQALRQIHFPLLVEQLRFIREVPAWT